MVLVDIAIGIVILSFLISMAWAIYLYVYYRKHGKEAYKYYLLNSRNAFYMRWGPLLLIFVGLGLLFCAD